MPLILTDLIPLSPVTLALKLRSRGELLSLEVQDARLYPWRDRFARLLGVILECEGGVREHLWVVSPELWTRLLPRLAQEDGPPPSLESAFAELSGPSVRL